MTPTAILNQPQRRGLLLVLSSPSGAGKTSLANALLNKRSHLSLSVSVTTRPMRPQEIDGKDYCFVSQEMFQSYIHQNAFLEHATVFGNAYGTLRKPVEACLNKGQDVLFDIDWQGAQQLVRTAAADVVRIFILPPALEALEERLMKRCQDSKDVIQNRMTKARDEISHWAEYDYVLINHIFEQTLDDLCAILDAERLKRERQQNLPTFVQTLLKDYIAKY